MEGFPRPIRPLISLDKFYKHSGISFGLQVRGTPIDKNYQKDREKVGKERGVDIWGPLNPPSQLGIRGSSTAVDWDICTGCKICTEVCPKQLWEWVQTPNHPTSEEKPLPARERICVQCYRCERGCPVQAILVIFTGPKGLTLMTVPLMFLQIVGGILYGIIWGPALGLTTLFWTGWILLAFALPLFFSVEVYFKKAGESGEGKSFMDTTVLVDSGTYSVVRHPQLLGGILMMFASILISQFWPVAVLGIFGSAWWYKWAAEEERGLSIKFGDDYERYMERVPRMNILLGIVRLLRQR